MSIKATIYMDTLKAAMAELGKIAAVKTTQPILSNILFIGQKGSVVIGGTDYERKLVCHLVDSECTADFHVCIPVAVLSKIVKVKAKTITLKIETEPQESVSIEAGAVTVRPICMDWRDYPILDDKNGKAVFTLTGEVTAWLHAFDSVSYAMSADSSRESLAAVCVEDKNGINFIATDTHRLAMIEKVPLKKSGRLDQNGQLLIPRLAVQSIMRLLKGADLDETVSLSVYKGRHCVMDIGGVDHFGFLQGEGRFPTYMTVIPQQTAHSVEVKAAHLTEAVQTVASFVSDRFKCIKLEQCGDTLNVSAKSPENGQASQELSAKIVGQFPCTGFNSQYILEAAQVATGQGDTVELHAIDEISPMIIRGQDKKTIHVCMPMRV